MKQAAIGAKLRPRRLIVRNCELTKLESRWNRGNTRGPPKNSNISVMFSTIVEKAKKEVICGWVNHLCRIEFLARK